MFFIGAMHRNKPNITYLLPPANNPGCKFSDLYVASGNMGMMYQWLSANLQ